VVDMPVSRIAAILFLFAFAASFFVWATFGLDSRDVALSAIDNAEFAVGTAYEAVLQAEKAGANVSGLLNELNDGAEALSKAQMSYKAGDFDDAVYFANMCCSRVEGIEVKASELREAAAFQKKQNLYLSSLSSIAALGCICIGGFFGWSFFKRRYYRQALKMKPEVASNES